jgi:hypothetical protein
MEYKDCLGVDIKIGDTIVYPVRRGSQLHMKSGTVLQLASTTQKEHFGGTYPALKVQVLSKPKDPTKIGQAKLIEVLVQRLERCVVAKGVE